MSTKEAIYSVCVLVIVGLSFIVCITAKAASKWARKEEILEEIQFKTILVEKKEETENVSEIVQEIEDKSESTDIEEAEREVTTTEETEYENETVVTEERIYVSTLEL